MDEGNIDLVMFIRPHQQNNSILIQQSDHKIEDLGMSEDKVRGLACSMLRLPLKS